MSALFTMLLGAIAKNGQMIYKYFLLGTFLVALTTFSTWFVDFMGDIYIIITNTVSSSAVTSYIPEKIGCVMHLLGIDDYFSSLFAIFFSASIFWLTAVSYIMAFKLSMKAYDGIFKANT